jgi:hypothetical protein
VFDDSLFSQVLLSDVHRDVLRNIVSIRMSQNLFDDLSNNPDDWVRAQHLEDEVKPPPYQSRTPVIHRPFEDAKWFNVIAWPFKHWQASRFSDGSFGVWYGSDSVTTTVYETAYHWFSGLLTDAGYDTERVIGERKVHAVACDAALLDFRPLIKKHAALTHKTDYRYTQSVGARLHREGHPGLITASARHAPGHNYIVLNPDVLSNARDHCRLTYRLEVDRIVVEQQPGTTWMEILTASF